MGSLFEQPDREAVLGRIARLTSPTTWEADVDRLRDLIGRFAARGPNASWPPSRAFGRISGRSWGVLQYKHLDHHLRQFGV